MEFLHRLLDKLHWALAGLIGAIATSFWHRDDLVDRKAWAIFIFSGAVCTHYLRGVISSYFELVEQRRVSGVGFLLGTFGGHSSPPSPGPSKPLTSGRLFASGSGEAIHHES